MRLTVIVILLVALYFANNIASTSPMDSCMEYNGDIVSGMTLDERRAMCETVMQHAPRLFE